MRECLDRGRGGCAGVVEFRESLSGTGVRIPRCDAHWEARLRKQAEHDKWYPRFAPRDFNPLDAGERWEEEES